MSTFAGAFNGLIAYGIVKQLDGARGWRAWRWIFLIEGIMPCVFSFVVLFLLPTGPSNVRFGFSTKEREQIFNRSLKSHNVAEAKVRPRQVVSVLKDLHFWLLCIIACCSHFCLSSLSNFIPDIIQVLKSFILLYITIRYLFMLRYCRVLDLTG
jgi:MFS family permease